MSNEDKHNIAQHNTAHSNVSEIREICGKIVEFTILHLQLTNVWGDFDVNRMNKMQHEYIGSHWQYI